MAEIRLSMFCFFLCMLCFISGVKSNNNYAITDDTLYIPYSRYITQLQFDSKELSKKLKYVEDEIKQYSPIDLEEWRLQNLGAIVEKNRLLSILKENFTSTMTILNYTSQAFEEGTTLLYLKSESSRAQAITEKLERLVPQAAATVSHMKAGDVQLAAMSAQQQETDRGLQEQQARLQWLRGEADSILIREGALGFRFLELLAERLSYQERIEAIKVGKKIVQDQVEKLKIRTAEVEEAITQARNELKSLKTRNSEVITNSPRVNFIKSVKTASGKGKKIKLILLSD